MSTKSCIIKKNKDATYTCIYCHWDGYIKGGVGETLYKHYKTEKQVNKLLLLGDLSTLGNLPIAAWDSTSADVCNNYRSRGETDIDAKTFNSLQEIVNFWDDCNYYYVFDDNKWWYFETTPSNIELIKEELDL